MILVENFGHISWKKNLKLSSFMCWLKQKWGAQSKLFALITVENMSHKNFQYSVRTMELWDNLLQLIFIKMEFVRWKIEQLWTWCKISWWWVAFQRLFWPEAIDWSIHILNWSPKNFVYNMRPEEAWSRHKQTIKHFWIFRCIEYALILNPKRIKLDINGKECIFLGVNEQSKGFFLILSIRNLC